MHPADGERQEWLELLLRLLIKPENWAGMLIKRKKRNWESPGPHNEVPCEAIVILLTVLCLTINKIARCSLQAWEQSVIWERGLPRVWVFLLCVMAVKYCLVSCVPLPPLSSCQPLSRYTSCAGLLQKKIKSYLTEFSHQLQAIIVKTEPLYVDPWQAVFGDYVVASWYLFRPSHRKWPQSPVCFSVSSSQVWGSRRKRPF